MARKRQRPLVHQQLKNEAQYSHGMGSYDLLTMLELY